MVLPVAMQLPNDQLCRGLRSSGVGLDMRCISKLVRDMKALAAEETLNDGMDIHIPSVRAPSQYRERYIPKIVELKATG